MLTRLAEQVFTYRTTDPEDLRRRRLLTILLLGVGTLSVLAFIITMLASLTYGAGNEQEVGLLYIGSVGALISVILIQLINRYWKGWVASVLFLVMLTVVFAFSDEPQQVAIGRSLFLFVIPVFVSSVLLRPYASFIFAAFVSMIVGAVGLTVQIVPSFASAAGFFMIALVSWLAARSLDRTLRELRVINRELDQRVAQRTQDLRQALARVQAESNKNQAILESIADGVIVFDQSGQAIVANPSIAHLLDRRADHIVDTDIVTLMGEDVDEADRERVTRLFQDKQPRTPSFTFRWGQKMLSISFAEVQDGSGEPIGHVMVCRDFTREAELDRMKSAFLSMASHEMRTPLNAILGYSDMLQEEVYGPLTAEQQKTMARVTANAQRMLALVNNLLDQAQIEAGRLSLHFEPFELQTLVEELKLVTTVLAETKGLKMVYEVEDDVPQQMLNDPQRLHQIALNLIGNAIKFTRQGMVRVKVYLQDSQHWAISISDTGPGIRPEAQAYIFDAFRQVDDPSTRDTMGSGLGLSIVKQLTNLLGGEVKLQSTVGQGSTFTVVLPIQHAQESIA